MEVFIVAGLLFIYTSIITFNRADEGGGILKGSCVVYMDDLTILANNTVNDFEGDPFIPA